MADPVDHPTHYNQGLYEHIDVSEQWFPPGSHYYAATKYIIRSPYKGNELQDLQKARWYVTRILGDEKNLLLNRDDAFFEQYPVMKVCDDWFKHDPYRHDIIYAIASSIRATDKDTALYRLRKAEALLGELMYELTRDNQSI